MLEKATEYAREREMKNICFARASVERLPFPDGVFDGVICSRDLHKFPDIVEALSEIARVMKRGARLAVLTVVKQSLSTFKMAFERVGASNPLDKEALEAFDVKELDKYLAQTGFDVEELDKYLTQTGFNGFAYTLYGVFYIIPRREELTEI